MPEATSLTSRQRFLAACRRKPVDRAPAWMMRQAGRYLPEYREIRGKHSFLEMVHTPEVAAEVTLQPIRRFGMDAAVIFSDILVPPAAMGMPLEFIEGRGPVMDPPVRSGASLARLKDFDAGGETGFLGEAIQRVRKELGDERGIIGFCGAPFTVASYMVEGQGSRNFEHTKQLLHGEPALFEDLLDMVVRNQLPYLRMQLDAGADVVQIFDSWGGSLDAATYRRVSLPHVKRLVEGVRETHPDAPVILYVNGASHLLETLADSGADVLGIDWRVDPEDAIRRVGGRCALQGNLDPCILFASPSVVEREAQRVLELFAPQKGYIFNLGSGILPKTPVPSVEALWRTVLGKGKSDSDT